MLKREELKKLHNKIERCEKCSLCKVRENTVPGEGPKSSKIMVIGQAPGVNEDKTGRPFIGRSGRLLDNLLKSAKIKREKIFVTSVVKCFPAPPANRKPTKEEIEVCLPYLKKQIEFINPQKFILLGEVAFSAFFQKEKLKDFRGKLIKNSGKKFFITYHPSAGLRFVKMKKILEKDFRKIKKTINF